MKALVDFIKKTKDPDDYKYGYSIFNDVNTVSNWQDSPTIKNIDNGDYWFFAENKNDPGEYYSVFEKIDCIDGIQQCTVLIRSGVPTNLSCEIEIISGTPVTISSGTLKSGKAIIGIIY